MRFGSPHRVLAAVRTRAVRGSPARASRLVGIDPLLLNVSDYERAAVELLDPGAYGYVAGGAGDERTLTDNVEAFARRHLRPRVLVDVSTVTTRATVMGADVSMPVLVAPTAFQRVVHADGEVATARGAAAAGTVMCLSTLSSVSPAELAEAVPAGHRWFQLYWSRDRGFTRDLLAQAAATGFGALVLTVDLPAAGRRERDLRTAFALPDDLPVPNLPVPLAREDFHAALGQVVDVTLTWRDLDWLRSVCDLPLVVKGVLTAEDALLAVEHGAEGVVVSNHGGRQLDGVSASLDALPEVAEAVADRAEVLFDGGVRRGGDVLKALALGARAVLVGRPVLWGLAVEGDRGVRKVLELLRAEIELGLRLLGCASPADVTRSHVAPAPH
ncbi:MAG: alpha-hydroxy-acid oxidizing protein [Actinomycetota bacterium]|nr:alpha-hydroxy-acid oxidizing protein [Actinomycetota bacterium]